MSMKGKNWHPKGETGWCFAIINGRLGEIFFQAGKGACGIWAHSYIERKEFTKRAQKTMDKDIEKHRLTYRKGRYRRKITQNIKVQP